MIDRLYKLDINGAGQWFLERGSTDARHMILFVHGGPGYPLMIFSRAFDTHLLDEFLVVHWDQRHSGKSFDPSRPPLRFTLEDVIADGIAVAAHLHKTHAPETLTVVGHSWGTMVGAGMVAREPDLFSAYVSAGTVGSHEEAERIRHRLLSEKLASDSPAAERLNEIGSPPYHAYEDVMAFGDLFSEHLGGEGSGWKMLSIEAVQAAVEQTQEYTEEELEHTVEGMGVVLRLTTKSIASFDARTAFPRIEVPTYFVQGTCDTSCPREPALDYFNKLDAPGGKYWVEFEGSAHFPMYEEPERFAQVLRAARSGSPPPSSHSNQ